MWEPVKLRLEEFRGFYRATRSWPSPLRYLALAYLYWLETKFIEAKTKAEIERAIASYEQLNPPYQSIDPIITETPSEVEGLPELRITAPWYERTRTRTED